MHPTPLNRLRAQAAGAALLLAPAALALLANLAVAQHAVAPARPAIASLSLDANQGLRPGSTLRVQVLAAPGARWGNVALGNGQRVNLRELERGRYVGTYTVLRSDRIDPLVMLTARFDHGGQITSRQFSYPPAFQALAQGAPAVAPLPAIERFVVRSTGRMEPGRELRLRVVGSLGGNAWVDIPGVARGIELIEERPGVYLGSYTVRRRDDPEAFANAVATLQAGRHRVTALAELRERQERDERDERQGFLDPRLPLDVTSHADNAATDARGHVFLQGRTAPHATVRIRMHTLAEVSGLLGSTQPVADLTVQADGQGRFGVHVQPRVAAIPGSRYEVHLTARSGPDVVEERLTLRARG